MEKKVNANNIINSPADLITSKENTRAGFISLALEKNYIAKPYIEEAKALKNLALQVNNPKELLEIPDLKVGLLTASGLSDKALNYLTEEDKQAAVLGLCEKFLEPAGDDFVNELVYRYLLTKGDALGGKARNLAGLIGERKFLRALISVFNIAGVDYKWKDSNTNAWLDKPEDDSDIEKHIKALSWNKNNQPRLLVLNIRVPLVNKNVDITIFNGTIEEYIGGKNCIIHNSERYIAAGELKGGIDPAGADEHWKTANSALNRIRISFEEKDLQPLTFFIGAAIQTAMADEIYNQLQQGVMTTAVNLTNEQQLTAICDWILNL